ncbi:DUF5683 domain-containing protein [Bacteroidota bacterium]
MNNVPKILMFLILKFIITVSVYGIEQSHDSLAVIKDSVFINENAPVLNDTIIPKPLEEFIGDVPVSGKKFEMAKSPTKAVLLSLLLPGLGQYYVESYWKVPIFLGAAGTLTYLIIDNNNKFVQKQNEWEAMDDDDPYKSLRQIQKEVYRDQRDMDAFYLFGVYILGAVDAYVGAHLYDFNVSDDLSLKFQTDMINGFRIGLKLEW